jgi:hypothetical protein
MKTINGEKRQISFPAAFQAADKSIAIKIQKISPSKIIQSSSNSINLVEAYRQRVLSQKTRTIRLLGRKNSARIIHTLLGYEVQASYKRIQCPDLVTARYIRLFSELGCHSIQLPYDPTLTAELIPGFETTLESITNRIRELFPKDLPVQRYALRQVFEILRGQIKAL